jgi:ADP-heptose:LPS heptosyltransferase
MMDEKNFGKIKILVINFGGLGDMVLTTPIFREIKRNFPNSLLYFLTKENHKEVFEGNINIDKLMFINKKESFKEALNFYWKLRKENFDIIIDLTKATRGFWISLFTRAKIKVGFKHKGREFIVYTHSVTRDNTKTICSNSKYVVEFFLDCLRVLGLNVKSQKLDLYLDNDDKRSAIDFLNKNGIKNGDLIIGLNPGVSIPIRRWPLENFAKLGDRLYKIYNAKILIIEGPMEKGISFNIASKMNAKPILVYGFKIKELASLISHFSLLITNDTGIKPIAVAMDVPTITIFGPTNYINYTPNHGKHLIVRKDLSCSPCGKMECEDPICIKSITIEEVLESVFKLL